MVVIAASQAVDDLTVAIDLRPPLKGEAGWFVSPDISPEEMLAQVIAGRESPDTGVHGFGWVAWCDMPPGLDSDGDIAITVIVTQANPQNEES